MLFCREPDARRLPNPNAGLDSIAAYLLLARDDYQKRRKCMSSLRLLMASALLPLAGVAHADTYTWDWSGATPPNAAISNVAGDFDSVHAVFDDAAQSLTWRVTFADQLTSGLTFALSDGPNPKGHAGELGLVYVDASNLGNIRTSTYAYNGKNLINSYKDGDGNQSGDQTPDRIQSIYDMASPLRSASVYDDGTSRVFDLVFDTTVLNSHSPLYPGSSTWTGVAFGEKLGLWMHTFTALSSSYSIDGYLTGWSYQGHGWFDGRDQSSVIPLPSAAGMGFAGLVLTASRRRP